MLFPIMLITQKLSFTFYSKLVTQKFYFCLLFRVGNSEILLFYFFEFVTRKFYFL